MEKLFEENVVKIKKLTKRPTNEELLQLYGLYKQATEGDNRTENPGFFNIKKQIKWDYWNSNIGMTPLTAKNNYNKLCKVLYEKYD